MSHLIRAGETLFPLAGRYQSHPQRGNPDRIRTGTALNRPGQSDSFGPPAPAAQGKGGSSPSVAAPSSDLRFDGGVSYSPKIEQLQRALVKVGAMKQSEMNGGPGHYGPLTRAAVNRIQQQAGISDDGGEHYGPLTRAALEKALGTRSASPAKSSTPTAVGSLSARDAETATKIDAVLRGYPGSRMQGMGAVIVAACRKEHVPVDLLMAQLAKESTFLRTENTLSIANNNPGNLRHASWESKFGGTPGQGGFERFPSIADGIRAYAHLIGSPALPYRALVEAKNWKQLVHVYAPASDGNNETEYVRQLTEWMKMFGGKIGVGSSWVNEK